MFFETISTIDESSYYGLHSAVCMRVPAFMKTKKRKGYREIFSFWDA